MNGPPALADRVATGVAVASGIEVEAEHALVATANDKSANLAGFLMTWSMRR